MPCSENSDFHNIFTTPHSENSDFHACSENSDFHDIFTTPVVKIQIFMTFSPRP